MSSFHHNHQNLLLPQLGASLILNFFTPHPASTEDFLGDESSADQFPRRKTVLMIGNYSSLMSSRAFSCLEAGYHVTLAKFHPEFRLSNEDDNIEILSRIQVRQFNTCQALPLPLNVKSCQRWLQSLSNFDDIALISLVEIQSHQDDLAQDLMISLKRACYNLRIPLNIADNNSLSDFTFPITYRWPSIDQSVNKEGRNGLKTSLQLTLSTSGASRHLENRLKREIVSKINERAGDACEAIAELRSRTRILANESINHSRFMRFQNHQLPCATISWPQTPLAQHLVINAENELDIYRKAASHGSENKLIETLWGQTPQSTWISEATVTRMRWISQIGEYWPINKIADLHHNPQAIGEILNISSTPKISLPLILSHPNRQLVYKASFPKNKLDPSDYLPIQTHSNPPKGRIYLVGSGPGHSSLLTCAAHTLLTKLATVVLSDKLIPDSIIKLIPKNVKLLIAKKFPGNAENAQSELMDQAIKYAELGETVVRLKQGDPFIYGRGGEEVLFFRKAGYEVTVIPGISSSIAGPLLFNIPVTQRGVSESLVLCTGVGRNGKCMKFPTFERSRTLIILMGLTRLETIIKELIERGSYPDYLPIAIIERASSFDQRMVVSTLLNIVDLFKKIGEQRPPGMMVIGWSVMCLDGNGEVDILDYKAEENQDIVDQRRIMEWLGGKSFFVKEGMSQEFDELNELFANL